MIFSLRGAGDLEALRAPGLGAVPDGTPCLAAERGLRRLPRHLARALHRAAPGDVVWSRHLGRTAQQCGPEATETWI